ncbi:MAG TPA: helix-turn-helix domain-containing protein [Pseudosphingobacterium sp.]|nr:helix-turn-helix domain-containing protein [Pseudosphingobacterium sp.]
MFSDSTSILLYLTMQHKELEPPNELKDVIRGFWYLEKNFGAPPSTFEVLPDGHAEIIFYFGSGCSIMHEGSLVLLPSPFIVGLLGKPIHFYVKDRLQIIGIKCFPWAVFDLLKLPADKSPIPVFEHPIANLQTGLKTLVEAGDIDKGLNYVKDWFINVGSPTASQNVLLKAGRAMLEANGRLPVSSVAAAAHATVRTLERKFKASSGHTIKDVSGLIRFEQARDHLWCEPDTGIASLAHELGYSDQSHLNREFKRYSGITAAAFARKMRAQKKRFGSDFVAIVLSS